VAKIEILEKPQKENQHQTQNINKIISFNFSLKNKNWIIIIFKENFLKLRVILNFRSVKDLT